MLNEFTAAVEPTIALALIVQRNIRFVPSVLAGTEKFRNVDTALVLELVTSKTRVRTSGIADVELAMLPTWSVFQSLVLISVSVEPATDVGTKLCLIGMD